MSEGPGEVLPISAATNRHPQAVRSRNRFNWSQASASIGVISNELASMPQVTAGCPGMLTDPLGFPTLKPSPQREQTAVSSDTIRMLSYCTPELSVGICAMRDAINIFLATVTMMLP